jgi:hypothetical protein
MKNSTYLIFLSVAIFAFLFGRCAGKKNCPKLETTVKVDTVFLEKIIEVDPIPAPVIKEVVKIHDPKDRMEIERLKKELENQVAYFSRIVKEKERVIDELAGIAGVGEVVAEEGVGFEIAEDQEVKTYEIDTTTTEGIRARVLIPVLGELYTNPLISLTIPEVFRHQTDVHDNTKNHAIGLTAALVADFENDRPDYRFGAYYRKKRTSFGVNYQVNTKAPALTLAQEFAWK